MATTGVKFPGSNESVTHVASLHDDFTWLNPTYVQADDTNYAAVTSNSFDSGTKTYVLNSYNFDTSWSSIPSTAVIDGVIVTARMWQTDGGVDVDFVYLLGTDRVPDTSGANMAGPDTLTSSEQTYTWGSSTDKWDLDLTASWVKDQDFGVSIGCVSTGVNSEVRIDWVKMEVYYHVNVTAAAPLNTLKATQLTPTVDIQQVVNKTVEVGVLTSPVSQPAPTASVWKAAAADIVSSQASQLAPTAKADANIIPTQVAGKLTAPNNPSAAMTMTYVPEQQAIPVSPLTATVDIDNPTPVTATPDVLTVPSATPAPSIFASAVKAIGEAIQGAFAPLAPVIAATCIVIPSPLAVQVTTQAPTISITGGATATPAQVNGTLSAWNNPSVIVSNIYVPSQQTISVSQYAATASISKAAAAPLVSGQLSQLAQSTLADANVSAGLMTGAFSTLTPTVLAGGSVSVPTDLVTGKVTVPSNPSVALSTIYVPSQQAGTLSLLEPTVDIEEGGGVTPVPAQVNGAFSTIAPTIDAGGSISAAAGIQTGAISTLAPTILASAVKVPTQITLILSWPTFTSSVESSVTPDVIAGQLSTLAPSASLGAGASASVIPGSLGAIAPTVSGTAIASAGLEQGKLTPLTASASVGTIASASLISGQLSILGPTASAGAIASAGIVTGKLTALTTATVATGSIDAPAPLQTGKLSVLAPSISRTQNPSVLVSPVSTVLVTPLAATMARRAYLWVKVSGTWRRMGIS